MIHPFHPLYNQAFPLLDCRLTWGERGCTCTTRPAHWCICQRTGRSHTGRSVRRDCRRTCVRAPGRSPAPPRSARCGAGNALAPQTSPQVVTRIDELLNDHTAGEIAARLNAHGYMTGAGRTFHRLLIERLCRAYHLTPRYDRLRARGLLTLHEIARLLDVTWCLEAVG